jgi:leucyl aminopeptidase
MALKTGFHKSAPGKADTAVIFIEARAKIGPAAAKLDRQTGGFISYHLKRQRKFTGKAGQTLILAAPAKALWTRIVLAGLGESDKLSALLCETTGGKLYPVLAGAGAEAAILFAGDAEGKIGAADIAARLALGLNLRSYRFDKYKSKSKDDENGGLRSIAVVTPAADKAKKAYAAMDAAVQGVFLARDVANEPPNVLYPESYARIIKKELAPLGVEVEILDARKLEKLGFGAHTAVGWGSARPPCTVVMRWRGGKKGAGKKSAKGKGPLAFVGKGVTFDTGGISIKPAGGMEDMKFDMCGSAAVVGLMKTLALRRSKADVVGIVGLAENMPGSRACRPSDIVKSLSGKYIEILNTDAEGRLVLCDTLTYVQNRYDPRLVVDLATLTGAIVVALGSEYAGAFVNDDRLWDNLADAAKATGEKLWRMPLDEAYRKAMESATADLRNTSTTGREAGSCTAAGFLERFIDKGRPWAHLDIAGVAWTKGDRPTAPKPAPGFGVLLLDRLVADHYE